MNANQKINRIRHELVSQRPAFQQAIELRAQLEVLHEQVYKAKNTPVKTLAFITANANGLQIKKVHPTDFAVPYVYQLFTAKSAWVAGDSVQECLDRAMAVKKDWTAVSTTDVNQLILANQALKESRAENTVQVSEVAA